MDEQIVRAILDRVRREGAGTRQMPGVIVGVHVEDTSIPYYRVHMYGDPPGNTIPVTAQGPVAQIGDKVMVTFDLPHGAFVLGGPSGGGGTGRPYATFLVAASNSIAPGFELADFVCDGTDDEIEIQDAIDAAAAVGGSVELLEGTFAITTGVVVIPTGVWLRGQGEGTLLDVAGIGIGVTVAGGWFSSVRLFLNDPGDPDVQTGWAVVAPTGGSLSRLWDLSDGSGGGG